MRVFRPEQPAAAGVCGSSCSAVLVIGVGRGDDRGGRAAAGQEPRQRHLVQPGDHSPTQIKVPAPGAPQTILLIGSDHRAGEPFKDANTDTMLLVRLDAASSTINVLSIPRDLEVDDPRLRHRASSTPPTPRAAPNLLIKTIKQNVFPQFVPNHIIDVNFAGFADLVDAIGCVYSDVDHRYYNQSSRRRAPTTTRRSTSSPATRSCAATTSGQRGAVVRALPPHRHRPRPRGAPAGLHPLGQGASTRSAELLVQPRPAAADLRQALAVRHAAAHVDGLLKLFDLVANMEANGAHDQADPVPGDVAAVRRHRPDDRRGDAVLRRLEVAAAVKSAWARFIAADAGRPPPSRARPPARRRHHKRQRRCRPPG